VARAIAGLLFLLFLPHGCSNRGPQSGSQAGERVNRRTPGGPPTQVLAVYEAWFGHPSHISVQTVGYSSQNPEVLSKQIRKAKSVGISAFVVDWYGYREPFIDHSYALMQAAAAKEKFHVAMMYDETHNEDGATDEAIEDFKLFEKTYLAADAPGRQAYLTYNGRPVIFIFPTQGHTDWNRVRAEVNKWSTPPWLINEYPPGPFAAAIDGYYAWVSPGKGGWTSSTEPWNRSTPKRLRSEASGRASTTAKPPGALTATCLHVTAKLWPTLVSYFINTRPLTILCHFCSSRLGTTMKKAPRSSSGSPRELIPIRARTQGAPRLMALKRL
jgi:hypothetical protein